MSNFTVHVLDHIPFNVNFKELARKAHVPAEKELEEKTGKLLNMALEAASPKALFRVCYITDRKEDKVTVEGVKFKSSLLSEKLSGVERVFPYLATCGTELDKIPIDRNDFMSEYLLDVIKEMALNTARKHLRNYLKENLGLKKIAYMSPGSGEYHFWPIQQQRELFSLLGDTRKLVGVTLTESFLMIPNKTVSGLFFPTEVTFETCELCSRENCPSRKAPFKGKMP
ncbi:MAG: vitamin B12 dependent methionine synthase [Spirochaetes bacterium]|nr:MAG: vitamin B12 dependent methionine synthase [Spirochaetota bacterium]